MPRKEEDFGAVGGSGCPEGFCRRYLLGQKRRILERPGDRSARLHISDYGRLPGLLRKLPLLEEAVSFFNCDVPLSQYYLYSRGLFPLGRCGVEFEDERLRAVRPLESPWSLEYIPPICPPWNSPMKAAICCPSARNALSVCCEGKTLVFDPASPETLLREMSRLLRRYDPDLLLTDRGDSFIIPALLRLSRRWKVPLPFDREPAPIRRAIVTEGAPTLPTDRSLQRTGLPLLRPAAYRPGKLLLLFGHRLRGARGGGPAFQDSPAAPGPALLGTAISSMQLDRAVQDGILIPWHKGEPEKFKTAWDLLVADKGGLTFQPVMGMHDNVAEIDFSSMYPTVMVQHNISAETILCPCCPGSKVPEAGYNICEKREGLVPRTLRPILERRKIFKGRMKNLKERKRKSTPGDRRPSSGSWWSASATWGTGTPVSGGSKRMRPLRAYGREKLLRAKEMSEAQGFGCSTP